MANVGVVIVSHSPKIAEGAADMVRQMVGDSVPLAWTGGNPEGGLGTDVAAIIAAIDRAWSDAGVVILVDLGGAETNSEMAIDLLDPTRRDKVLVCEAPVVEGAVMAATEASGGAALDAVTSGLIESKKPHRFRAAIAYYPWCKNRDGSTTVPTLILIGDQDDWTSASWCQQMVADPDRKGSPVDLVVYPGAWHAFNYPGPPRQYLGHHIEYNPTATADAWSRVRHFLHDTLGSR